MLKVLNVLNVKEENYEKFYEKNSIINKDFIILFKLIFIKNMEIIRINMKKKMINYLHFHL